MPNYEQPPIPKICNEEQLTFDYNINDEADRVVQGHESAQPVFPSAITKKAIESLVDHR